MNIFQNQNLIYFHFEIMFIFQLFSQGTPRNIYRHVILSDIKDATTSLPRVRTIEKSFIFNMFFHGYQKTDAEPRS